MQTLPHLSGKRLTFLFSEADTSLFFGHATERDQITTPDVEQRKIQSGIALPRVTSLWRFRRLFE